MSKNWIGLCTLLLILLTAVQIVHASDNNTDDWYKEGDRLLDLGQYQGAIIAFDKALSLDPNYADAWVGKGNVLYYLEKYDEAIAAYDKALSIDPKSANVSYNKGKALSHLGRYQDALDAYDKALSIDPNNAWAWNAKGNALSDLGRYQEALDAYDKALSINPNYAGAWNNKGLVLDELGKHQEAIEAFDKALSLDPNDELAMGNKKDSLFQSNPLYTISFVIVILFLLSAIISFIYLVYQWLKSRPALLFKEERDKQALKYAEHNKIVSLAMLFDLLLSGVLGTFFLYGIISDFVTGSERDLSTSAFIAYFIIIATINIVICSLFLIKWRKKPEKIGKELWFIKILFSLLGIVTIISAVVLIIIYFSYLRKNQIPQNILTHMIMQADR